MTGTLDENDVRACDDCHLHGTALRIREAVAEIKRLRAERQAITDHLMAMFREDAGEAARATERASGDTTTAG